MASTKWVLTIVVEADSARRAIEKASAVGVVVEARPQPEDVWGEDPAYAKSDWEDEVANGDTVLGYWDWVQHAKDCDDDGENEEEDEDEDD